ncbi:MAG: hypothetical protein AAB731_04535 [Patescibacteria group bacterium]
MAKKGRRTSKKVKAERDESAIPSEIVAPRPYEPSSRSYFRIAVAFILATVILVSSAAYFVFYGVQISVKPERMPVSAEAIYEVKENPLSVNSIRGKLAALEEEKSVVFSARGGGKAIPDYAHGQVTVYNKSGRVQKLVAKTRFLSEGGILFRLREAVFVPAGGQKEMEVFADEPGVAGNILAGKFILPGLSAALQAKIYAQSDSPMTGGEKTASIIQESEIKEARETIIAELDSALRKKILESFAAGNDVLGIAFSREILNQESSHAAGEEANEFTIKIRMRVAGVSWGADLGERAAEILAGLYPSGKELVSDNLKNLEPQIIKYNETESLATVRVNISGMVIPSADNPLFKPDNFAGLSKDEIVKYLTDKKLAESAGVRFFPFWLKRAPYSPSHIKIIIEK